MGGMTTETGYEPWILDWVAYAGGTEIGPRATVHLSRLNETVEADGFGAGLVDAACDAVMAGTGVRALILTFKASSYEPGPDVVVDVVLETSVDDAKFSTRASSGDLVEATARALLSAINLAGLQQGG